MPRARRTEAAERDLRDIAYQIALKDHRPLTADQIIDELIEPCDNPARLSTSSVLGTDAPDIREGVRLFRYKRWVILFRYESHGVDVLRFADGSQDYLSWRLP
jgi:plasmid stabilization system protein ParE